MNNNQKTIAIDLGGTWMRAAVVAGNGTIIGPLIRKPTGRRRSPEEIIKDLISLMTEAASLNNQREKKAVTGAAIGVPTPIDDEDRLVASDNLPTMGGFALGREVRKRTGLKVGFFHDADCFTVGEWRHGIGKGKHYFCGVTLGTGIGLGIIADGHIIRGGHGLAGEIWKSPLGEAQVEDFVSGPGLTRIFKTKTGRSISGKEIHGLAGKGDPEALAVFAEFGGLLGKTLAWIINCFDPDAIALGGSVAHSFVHFERPMQAAMAQYCSHGVRARVAPAILGEKAAIIGAALLFKQ